ncbi:hypothetical protein A1Q2_06664 [Trichosporon asahii var. asahii CBS 8904]|uniref:Uncharacterized protein n=1 Tax=Trichosporon asahii var. asahii (strain CBS 8904) TaxID=1220162 RepID=K1VDH6_TRIAC|nr:hypothetical protein A1Q2_06664 [Trichosporon asahii var. asahii CBS 8904]
MTTAESVASVSSARTEYSSLVTVELNGDEDTQLTVKTPSPLTDRLAGACGPIPGSDTVSQLLFVPSDTADVVLKVQRKSSDSNVPNDLIRVAILDDDNKRTLLRALPKAEIVDVRTFLGRAEGTQPQTLEHSVRRAHRARQLRGRSDSPAGQARGSALDAKEEAQVVESPAGCIQT